MKGDKAFYITAAVAITAVVAIFFLASGSMGSSGDLAGHAVAAAYAKPVFVGNVDASARTGDGVCRELGYSGCIAAEHTYTWKHYASTDRSCEGLEEQDYHSSLLPCNYPITMLGSSCGPAVPSDAQDPWDGDEEYSGRISSVICLD